MKRQRWRETEDKKKRPKGFLIAIFKNNCLFFKTKKNLFNKVCLFFYIYKNSLLKLVLKSRKSTH